MKMGMFEKINDLKKRLKDIDGTQITIGIQPEGKGIHGENIHSDEELQKIAYVHEYGYDIHVTPKMRAYLHRNGMHLQEDTTVIHIPERSFIRKAAAEGEAMGFYDEILGRYLTQYLDGKIDADKAFDEFGKRATAFMAAYMNQTQPPSSYTLEHRETASNTPLVDTGKLQHHVSYNVKKKAD